MSYSKRITQRSTKFIIASVSIFAVLFNAPRLVEMKLINCCRLRPDFDFPAFHVFISDNSTDAKDCEHVTLEPREIRDRQSGGGNTNLNSAPLQRWIPHALPLHSGHLRLLSGAYRRSDCTHLADTIEARSCAQFAPARANGQS